jgi:putative ABC transport system permease protein
MSSVRTVVRAGLAGRRVQTWAIGLVMLATTATSTLAAGLVADANAPFDHAFAAQRGADAVVVVSPAKAPAGALAATARLAGVTAAAGPFAQATVTATTILPNGASRAQLSPLTLVARSSPGGPVDDIVLSAGHWPARAGQVVVSRGPFATQPGLGPRLGQVITLTGVPGRPRLTVAGVGTSATGTATGWVLPAEMAALRIPLTEQMLYRFARPGSGAGSGAAVSAGLAAVRRALPAGSVAGAGSWLTAKAQDAGLAGPAVPFLVIFGLIGLVMSVLIVVNVVSGMVVAGTRRIGLLKSVGFTPGQVVAVYVLQAAVPAAAGAAAGVVVANLMGASLLGRAAQVLAVGSLSVPPWADLAMPLALLGLAGIAALVPASRAGRLSAVQAIAVGRAPRAKRGQAALRLLGRLGVLPRPVTIGLAGTFTRPGRTLVTFAAVMSGAVAVTFGAGLGSSIDRVVADTSLPGEQVQVSLPGPPGQEQTMGPNGLPGPDTSANPPSVAAQERAAATVLRSQPGTLHYVAESGDQLTVPGLAGTAWVTAFGGDASWTGYTLISGRWYAPGGAVVNTAFLEATGKHVGDTFTLAGNGRSVTLTITGEALVFGPPGSSAVVLTNLSPVASLDPSGLSPLLYDVGLRPGASAQGYLQAVAAKLGPAYTVVVPDNPLLNPLTSLVVLLALLLAAVAALGVLNAVVMMTRERVHDLGVFKAVGMTPRQVIVTAVTTVAVTGLVAGLIAVPAGIALQRAVLPVMANGAQTAIPAAASDVYRPAELVLLALAGLVIAVAGALAPAGWAARTPTALALRAE